MYNPTCIFPRRLLFAFFFNFLRHRGKVRETSLFVSSFFFFCNIRNFQFVSKFSCGLRESVGNFFCCSYVNFTIDVLKEMRDSASREGRDRETTSRTRFAQIARRYVNAQLFLLLLIHDLPSHQFPASTISRSTLTVDPAARDNIVSSYYSALSRHADSQSAIEMCK